MKILDSYFFLHFLGCQSIIDDFSFTHTFCELLRLNWIGLLNWKRISKQGLSRSVSFIIYGRFSCYRAIISIDWWKVCVTMEKALINNEVFTVYFLISVFHFDLIIVSLNWSKWYTPVHVVVQYQFLQSTVDKRSDA